MPRKALATLQAVLLALLAYSAPAASIQTQGGTNPERDALALRDSAARLGRPVGDYLFRDSDGRDFKLSDYRGKPLVISLVYTSCSHTCPLITTRLAAVTRTARAALGTDSFAVLTAGFDTVNDTPERMKAFARERGIDTAGWRFASTDAASMRSLMKDLGFSAAPAAQGFDHLSQVTIVDAGGRVYRQVYGDEFSAPSLVEPLKELVFGQPQSASLAADWWNGIKLFCTVYDPASGRYRINYSWVVELFTGVTCLGGAAYVLARTWAQNKPSS